VLDGYKYFILSLEEGPKSIAKINGSMAGLLPMDPPLTHVSVLVNAILPISGESTVRARSIDHFGCYSEAKTNRLPFSSKEPTRNSGKYKIESPFSRPNNLIDQLFSGYCLRTDAKSENHSII